ncbi:hypothetical protein AGLY_008381 [Aphis glycines]|uniref:Uncharacterized protein n=1 Tax=Aphis glycines TaxID=307491 RepID=A0A6G0TLR2_APHGL|nr:hypothetical protein AGLY_008381 [Aphis glycines]
MDFKIIQIEEEKTCTYADRLARYVFKVFDFHTKKFHSLIYLSVVQSLIFRYLFPVNNKQKNNQYSCCKFPPAFAVKMQYVRMEFPGNKNNEDGLWVMVSSVMPESLADWYMSLSTSILTALVHSSRRANDGLKMQILAKAILCFSPPDRTSFQSAVASQPPSLCTKWDRWTWARHASKSCSVMPLVSMSERVSGTLNRDDLPHPLGPVISRCSPGFIVIVRLDTTTSLLGVTMGTSNSDMLPSGLFFTTPVNNTPKSGCNKNICPYRLGQLSCNFGNVLCTFPLVNPFRRYLHLLTSLNTSSIAPTLYSLISLRHRLLKQADFLPWSSIEFARSLLRLENRRRTTVFVRKLRSYVGPTTDKRFVNVSFPPVQNIKTIKRDLFGIRDNPGMDVTEVPYKDFMNHFIA